jgi:UDP-glucose 4-epimerase
MKIGIIGGAGYVGTELVDSLVNMGNNEVAVYDNLSRRNYNLFLAHRSFKERRMEFVEGDLLDDMRLSEFVKRCDIVVNLAAKVTTPFADLEHHQYEQVNHWGNSVLAQAVEEGDVRKLIYVSSTAIYGSHDHEMGVGDKASPRSIYGYSKLKGEEQLKRLGAAFPLYILRAANVYGYSRSMRFDAVVNRFVFDAHFKGRISIFGSGEQFRPFIHVRQLVHAITRVIQEEIDPGVYDLVERNETVLSIAEVIKEVYPEIDMIFVGQNMEMRNLKIRFDEEQMRKLGVMHTDLYGELMSFRREFAFQPPLHSHI